jgi:hypothetical protein
LLGLLGACGGGGAGSGATAAAAGGSPAADTVRTLGCTPDLSLALAAPRPAGRLVNNTWNRAAAGSAPWSQCLVERGSGSAVQVGWAWNWPANGTQVFAYPEIVIGAKPWDAGPGNDARFPRSIASTPQLRVSYDTEVTASGSYNTAASIWMIRTPQVASVPVLADITAEIMVWTDYTPDMVSDSGPVTPRGEVTLDGQAWRVFAAEDWGDGSGGTAQRWRFIVYVAKVRSAQASFDARKMIDDAVARGLVDASHHIANVELGNEIAAGAGQTWVRSFAVTLP